VHGRLRNAQTYLQSGVEAAELPGKAARRWSSRRNFSMKPT
jgi:hypothetical protein